MSAITTVEDILNQIEAIDDFLYFYDYCAEDQENADIIKFPTEKLDTAHTLLKDYRAMLLSIKVSTK